MNKKPAKYLDLILEILSNNFENNFSVNDLMNKIELKKNPFGEKIDVFHPDLSIELKRALTFLSSKKLIHYNSENAGEIRMLYEGYLKIRTNSFTDEIKDKSINKTLQRISWIVPILISFIALMVSFFNNSQNQNCIYKNKSNVHKTQSFH
jgi:hypothetical protein